MKRMEELQMNAFPSLQTHLYDGWVLRFADGFTNRANSINPIYEGTEDIADKIEKCAELYRSRGLAPVYRITPCTKPGNLDDLLHDRGYRKIRSTSVQTMKLAGYSEGNDPNIRTTDRFTEEWLDASCTLGGTSDRNRNIYRRMLRKLTPNAYYSLLEIRREVVGCGMAVLDEGYIGLFDIAVSEQYRGQGYGTQLVAGMLAAGKERGATDAYLQVMTHNTPALKLYSRFGFHELYEYHYRVLDEGRDE